jgi:hypothetical protein
VLAVLVAVEVWVQPVFQTGLPGPRAAVTVAALLVVAPVVVRRRRPLLALLTAMLGLLLLGLVAEPQQSGFPCSSPCWCSCGRSGRTARRRWRGGRSPQCWLPPRCTRR